MNRFRRQSSLYLSYLLLSTILVQVIAASNGYPEEYTNSDGLIDMKVANSSEVVRQYGYAKAYFGDPFSDNPAEYSVGMIHTANPIDGCTQLESPPDDTELWVALIERSGAPGSSRTCTFIEKVYNAQLAGYGIVIIYDYVKNAELEEMYSNNESLEKLVNIPSAFVAYGTGMDMKARSYPDSQAVMSSVMFRPFKEDILDPYKILIPMAFSFVGILLVAVIIMIVRWCQALRRRRRSRISKSQLKKIPLVKYKKEDQYDCCAICLDDYVEGEKVRLLPCSHTYHKKCIDPWLLKNKRTCPVCKRRVVPRKPRRTRRADDSSSDSEFEAGHNERRPLLPPPHHESGDEEAGYGAVGYRPQTEGSERQSTSSSRPGSSNSTRHNRAQDILYERAYTPHSTDSDSSDDGADLRHPASLLAQRRPSNSINAGEHSLRSWPTRSTVEEYMPRIPPLNNTATEAPQRAESPVAMERSHDELVAMDPSHDQPEVVIEAPHHDSDEEMQAVITPTASNQNDII